MADHAARDHAQWSASSTERNWNCSGALALTDGLPETTNEAADWGTCCHQIAEKCLRDGRMADEFIGTTEKGKKYEFEVDEEMAETAQTYVDYVRERVIKAAPPKVNPASLLQIEQRFTLESLKPPFEAGGTADSVIYFPLIEELEVVDLKGGRGHVVEVIGNPQLRTYGLGAMLANPKLKVKTIKVTIVQPRANHKSGRIRSETFHVADLVEWTADLLLAMSKSRVAMNEYHHIGSSEFHNVYPTQAAWARDHLSAGDHCKFCKAAGFCPALQQKAYDAAGVWFDDLDQPRLANSPSELSPEALAQALDAADMIGEWINAVRAYAHAQAEMGIEIPNYQLVEKIGHRKWNASEEQIVAALQYIDVDPFNRKLVSPAQAEKLLGARRKSEIAGLIERPVTGTNLTRADKTTRPAATPSVNKHFDILV